MQQCSSLWNPAARQFAAEQHCEEEIFAEFGDKDCVPHGFRFERCGPSALGSERYFAVL